MDFYRDSLGSTLKLIAPVLPDFVKQANYDLDAVESLPDEAFAWPEKRAYPINRPEDILMSTAYFVKAASDGEQIPVSVKENLGKAAFIWKIEDQFIKVASDVSNACKLVPTIDEVWGLEETYKGEDIREYPLFDQQHVKLAAARFETDYKNYPLTWRVKLAHKIANRELELGLHLPEDSRYRCYARQLKTNMSKLAAAIDARIPYLRKQGLQDECKALEKVAQVIGSNLADLDHVDLATNVLLKIDKIAHLDQIYDRGIPDPFMSVYNSIEKFAEEHEETVNLCGDTFKVAELANVPLSVYENALGTDFTSAIGSDMSKLAEVLPTLPRDEAKTLSLHLQSHLNR